MKLSISLPDPTHKKLVNLGQKYELSKSEVAHQAIVLLDFLEQSKARIVAIKTDRTQVEFCFLGSAILEDK